MNKLYPFYISIFIPSLHSVMYRKIDTKRLNNKHIDNRAICRNRNSPITFFVSVCSGVKQNHYL